MKRTRRRATATQRQRNPTGVMLVNIGVLVLCLVTILVFKQVVGERVGGLIDTYTPNGGEETAAQHERVRDASSGAVDSPTQETPDSTASDVDR